MSFNFHLYLNKMQCPFCHVDEEKTKIICSGSFTIVIFSNPRLIPGHLLVIPKRHVQKLSELSQNEQDELWRTTIEFQEKIISGIAPGCDIRQNYRPFLKQNRLKVDHLHIHLIPRSYKDNIFRFTQLFEKNLFRNLNKKEIKKFLPILKGKNQRLQ